MNMNPPGQQCRGCRFYHGRDNVVCGVHPYGKESASCVDFVPRIEGLKSVTSTKNDSRQVHSGNPSARMRLFVLIILVFVGGLGLSATLGKVSTLLRNLKVDAPANRSSSDISGDNGAKLLNPQALF